jgi:hypothetical protein
MKGRFYSIHEGRWEEREVEVLSAGEARALMKAGLTRQARSNQELTRQFAWLTGGIQGLADDQPVPYLISENIKQEFGEVTRE